MKMTYSSKNTALCMSIILGHPDDPPMSGGAFQSILDLAEEYGKTLQFGVTASFAVRSPDWLKQIQAGNHALDGYLVDLPPSVDRNILESRLTHLESVLAQCEVDWWGLLVDKIDEVPIQEYLVPALMDRGYRWMCTPGERGMVSASWAQPHTTGDDFFTIPRFKIPESDNLINNAFDANNYAVIEIHPTVEEPRVISSILSILGSAASSDVPFLSLNEIADISRAAHQASPQAQKRVSVQAYLHYKNYWDTHIGPTQQAYKIFDYRNGWRLKPGCYRNTSGEWMRLSAPDLEHGFQVNRHGFRGEILPHRKDAGEIRIIAVGDSCVFGVAGEDNPWPARAEARIAELSEGSQIRVINAGIEGQSSAHCWMRLKRLLSFDPDMVLISVLANDLFIEDPGDYWEIMTLEYATSWEVIGEYPRTSNLPEVIQGKRRSMALKDFYPHNYVKHLRQMAHETQNADVLPVLMTSPPLLPADLSLTGADHLTKMHHPPFVDQGDMGTMRRLYEIYNDAIRQLAMKEDIPLIDGEKYFQEYHDHQRQDLFSDTCHPTVRGNSLLGAYVGEQLWKIIQDKGY